MAWWTKVGDKVEKHDGPRPKFAALIHCNFAVNAGGAKREACGIYRRDPVKHPDEPNVLAAMIEKASAKRFADEMRSIGKGKRR